MTHCYTTYTTVTAYTTATTQSTLCCGLLLGVKTPLQVDLVSLSITTTTTATATAITRWETMKPTTHKHYYSPRAMVHNRHCIAMRHCNHTHFI